jgi:hypothetical protein
MYDLIWSVATRMYVQAADIPDGQYVQLIAAHLFTVANEWGRLPIWERKNFPFKILKTAHDLAVEFTVMEMEAEDDHED